MRQPCPTAVLDNLILNPQIASSWSGIFCSILPKLLKTDEVSNLEVTAFQ